MFPNNLTMSQNKAQEGLKKCKKKNALAPSKVHSAKPSVKITRQIKKQEKTTHDEEKNQFTETDSGMIQIALAMPLS